MENTSGNSPAEERISDEQLESAAGGKKSSIQKRRLEHLDTNDSSKSINNIQQARLEHLDSNDSSK